MALDDSDELPRLQAQQALLHGDTMLTPYAVLSITASSTDDDVRARYHSRIRLHHPDMRPDRKPGPEWEALTEAYRAICNQAARDRWIAAHRLRSGFCKACKGYGVTARAGQCAACRGAGRVSS